LPVRSACGIVAGVCSWPNAGEPSDKPVGDHVGLLVCAERFIHPRRHVSDMRSEKRVIRHSPADWMMRHLVSEGNAELKHLRKGTVLCGASISRKVFALDAVPPLAGRLSRPHWITRRMITSMQKLQYPGILRLVGHEKSGASASPTETPQFRDTAAYPHRNPTDETAHSGTLVMRVKSTENSRRSAWMRVSWAVGDFSR
jgi:hypothetical protein